MYSTPRSTKLSWACSCGITLSQYRTQHFLQISDTKRSESQFHLTRSILPWVQAPGLGRTASDAVVEEVIRVSEQMIWYGTKVDRMGSVGP